MPPMCRRERAEAAASSCTSRSDRARSAAHAYAYVNTGEAAPQSYVLRMGDPHNRLDPVEPAVPRVF